MIAGAQVEPLGLGKIGRILPARVDRPMRYDGSAQRGEQIGVSAAARGYAWQRNFLRLEIETLSHPDPQPLDAALVMKQAGRDAQRHLICVANAVVPAEQVFGIQRREVDVLQRAVEIGYQILLARRDVNIIDLGFERLQQILTEQDRVALEYQTAVSREYRHRTVLDLIGDCSLVEIIASQVDADLGRQIGKRRLQWRAQTRVCDGALAAGQRGMRKVDEAAVNLEIGKPDVLFRGAKSKLRAVVRGCERIQRVGLQRLPALHQPRYAPGAAVPPCAAFCHGSLARQHRL